MERVQRIERMELSVEGAPLRAFIGGEGPPLLLVHGGWGGAQMHFGRVWEALAAQHRVITPDLPGLGALEQSALPNVRAYAERLLALLDALEIERAFCLGNSFGASVVCSLAGRNPERCAGLVLVNGMAMPRTPAPLRHWGHTWFGRAVVRTVLTRFVYTESALARAFVDPSHVPASFRAAVHDAWPVIVPRYAALLIEGDGPPAPRVAPHLLWGADDRLPGTRRRDGERLHRALAGSTLTFVERAGHFPQLEAPEAFVAQLEAILHRCASESATRPAR